MRCQLAGRALASLRKEFPDVEVEKVGYVTNRQRAREAGVNSFPTLASGDQQLSGVLLTKGMIRGFLAGLSD